MNRDELLYLSPYVISVPLSLGIFLYIWRHRYVRGARTHLWIISGQILTTLGFTFELLNPDLETKIFWDKFQWLTLSYLVLLPLLIFTVQYSEYKLHYSQLLWGSVIAFLIGFTLILLTDNIHHLLYPNPHLGTEQPFPELKYDYTFVVYIYALFYLYGVNFYGISLLFRRAFQPHSFYRLQYLTIAAGFLIPLLLSFFSVAEIRVAGQRDITPLAFAIGNLIVAWGLFRYGLFDIAPIARERIIENMSDLVIVLDAQNRIVDINPVALRALGRKSSDVLSQPAERIFAEWPQLLTEFLSPQDKSIQITLPAYGNEYQHEVKSTLLRDQQGKYVGRVFVSRDVTAHVELQSNLQRLNEELEQRVRERTEELWKSAERYRAVVENQTELIVRWKPDGTRTFVNEAYCRYWGITYEQALAINFLFHIAEEDRPAVEAKIAHLHGGVIDSETEIHRVIKPDGSIAWQEWTDHAIRDETGQIIEFQSVGRDITERMQAEEALRESEQRFATLSTATFEAIGLSEEGRIIDVNEQMLSMFGYTRAEMLGMHVEQLVAPESLGLVKRHRSLNWEEPYEHIAVKKNGTFFPVEVRPRMIPYRGRLLRVTAIRDMTERKQAEEALQKSEERFSKAFQASPVMIVIFGIDNARILEVNDTFETVSGFSRQEAIGKTALELGLWANPTNRDRIVSKLVTDGRLRSAEIQFVTKDGRTLTCLFSAELIELGGEKCGLAVIEDITERKRAEEALTQAYDTTLEGWAKALELRDKETEGHSRRVTETTLIVARAMGFTEEELLHIRRGSILHDIGKMGIPDEILRKNGALTDEERIIVEKHPNTALDLLKGIPFLEKALEIPYNHHEKWDGTGYPCGLEGTEIPLTARIFAVVDVWDALSTDRPYRQAWPREKVMEYLMDESEKHFDPKVVEIFLQLLREGKI